MSAIATPPGRFVHDGEADDDSDGNINSMFENGTLSMVLNPTDQPADIACIITAAPVSTGDYSQHGEVLRLSAWSAVVWASPERS